MAVEEVSVVIDLEGLDITICSLQDFAEQAKSVGDGSQYRKALHAVDVAEELYDILTYAKDNHTFL